MPFANLLVDLADARFEPGTVHHAIEALDRDGVYVGREHVTSDAILPWIDAEFGGVWSSEAAAGGTWIASESGSPIGFCAFDARGLRRPWLRAWAGRPDVGIFGPFGVAESARRRGIGTVLARAALFALRERGYRYALVPAVGTPELERFYEARTGARVVERFARADDGAPARAVVLASGNGSNFQAALDASRDGSLPIEIVRLIANRPSAFALARADAGGLARSVVVWDRARESRADYDARLLETVVASEPELVVLLGWMHVLAPSFVARFGELVNLHPALLPLDPTADVVAVPGGATMPAFRGARAIDDALAAGAPFAGATLHRVEVPVDSGAVLARAPLALVPGEPRERLDARLHELERRVVRAGLRRWSWERA